MKKKNKRKIIYNKINFLFNKFKDKSRFPINKNLKILII